VPLVGVHDFEYPDAEDFEDGEAIGPVDCDMCGGTGRVRQRESVLMTTCMACLGVGRVEKAGGA
jgi:DnaJ-class molecular chaperone